jgi:hypothetical protein
MGFPFPRKIEVVGPELRADDFTAIRRPKVPFIRFSFYRPTIEVYQTILMKELLEAESYASLTRDDYVQSKVLPGSVHKTKLCVAEGVKPVFLDATDKVVSTELLKQQIKTFDEYCIRFFEYRQATLEQAVGIVEPSLRDLVRVTMKFNRYAIDQTNSGLFSI